MGARNGTSVFDLITNGWSRTVRDNGDGELFVSIPAEFRREHGIEQGDDVAIKEGDGEGPVLECRFG